MTRDPRRLAQGSSIATVALVIPSGEQGEVAQAAARLDAMVANESGPQLLFPAAGRTLVGAVGMRHLVSERSGECMREQHAAGPCSAQQFALQEHVHHRTVSHDECIEASEIGLYLRSCLE
jgi:hypothetical protein